MRPAALIISKDGPAIRFDFDNEPGLTNSEWVLVLEMAKLQLMGFKPNALPANMKIPGMLMPGLERQR